MSVLSGLDLSAQGYLVDLDGTLVSGGKALPWAGKLLAAIAGRFVIVSNDAEHTSRQLAAALSRLGLPVRAADVLLAGEFAIRSLAEEQPGRRVQLLASAALHRFAARHGLLVVADGGEVVLVGRDRSFSYESIARAAAALHDGASLIVANPDGSHPGPDGRPVPETGALAAAIIAAAGHPPHRIIGKPEPALFRAGLQHLKCPASDAIMIGDNPETDGKGALALGMGFFNIRAKRGAGQKA